MADDGLLTAILHTISDLRKQGGENNFELCALAVAAWIRRAGGGNSFFSSFVYKVTFY